MAVGTIYKSPQTSRLNKIMKYYSSLQNRDQNF